MKYIHHDVEPICSFITGQNLISTKIPMDGRKPGEISSASELFYILEKSKRLWGTSLDYFFIISDCGTKDSIDLKNAIVSIESGAVPGFILVAYQDGGVISVSGKAYPFQKEAESAAWWYA